MDGLVTERSAGIPVLWLIGAYAIVSGLVRCVLAFRARGFGPRLAERG